MIHPGALPRRQCAPGKDAAGVRAEWDIHWAHFPFPVRLSCTPLKTDFFLLTRTVFAKTILLVLRLNMMDTLPISG